MRRSQFLYFHNKNTSRFTKGYQTNRRTTSNKRWQPTTWSLPRGDQADLDLGSQHTWQMGTSSSMNKDHHQRRTPKLLPKDSHRSQKRKETTKQTHSGSNNQQTDGHNYGDHQPDRRHLIFNIFIIFVSPCSAGASNLNFATLTSNLAPSWIRS